VQTRTSRFGLISCAVAKRSVARRCLSVSLERKADLFSFIDEKNCSIPTHLQWDQFKILAFWVSCCGPQKLLWGPHAARGPRVWDPCFIPSCISHWLHTKFHWNRRNFLWTDGRKDKRTDIRTYGRADGHLRPTVLGLYVCMYVCIVSIDSLVGLQSFGALRLHSKMICVCTKFKTKLARRYAGWF